MERPSELQHSAIEVDEVCAEVGCIRCGAGRAFDFVTQSSCKAPRAQSFFRHLLLRRQAMYATRALALVQDRAGLVISAQVVAE